MYCQPVDINDPEDDPLVCSVRRLLFVADTYHSLAVVLSVVETYVKNLKTSRELALLCAKHPRDLLDLAIKLRRKWLFKEVVCRLIGDPTRDDEEIGRIFKGYESRDLILEKREELRALMKKVDEELLTMTPSPPFFTRSNNWAKILGVARFRDLMINRMSTWRQEKSWREYPSKYREILKMYRSKTRPSTREISFFNDIEHHHSLLDKLVTNVNSVHETCLLKATRIIEPLWETFVKTDVREEPENLNRRFTCISVGDDDLPW